jgi:hypothetical protein
LIRLAALALLGGCIDFVEPELPERGAPAVLQLAVRLREASAVEVEARLVPGLDEAGARRRVDDDRIQVLGRNLSPDSITSAGTRVYRTAWTADVGAATGPIEARGPRIEGLAAAAAFRWYALTRSGPAELPLGSGDDLALPVAVAPGTADPEPDIRQWFLTLGSREGVFRLSADGPPPATILVPARWVPPGDSVAVSLTYQQTAKVERPGAGWIALFQLDARVAWTVRRGAAPKGQD